MDARPVGQLASWEKRLPLPVVPSSLPDVVLDWARYSPPKAPGQDSEMYLGWYCLPWVLVVQALCESLDDASMAALVAAEARRDVTAARRGGHVLESCRRTVVGGSPGVRERHLEEWSGNVIETLDEQMGRIARYVAGRYAARCWWADAQDLEQQAWAVVLEVLREYPPTYPDGNLNRDVFGATAHVAAMRQLSRYLWRQSSPASAADCELRELAGVLRAPIGQLGHVRDSSKLVELMSRQLPIDEVVWYSEARGKIRARVEDLCGRDELVRAGLSVLLDGEAPREVVEATGLDVWSVYKTTEWMKGKIRVDGKLRDLCSALLERR